MAYGSQTPSPGMHRKEYTRFPPKETCSNNEEFHEIGRRLGRAESEAFSKPRSWYIIGGNQS